MDVERVAQPHARPRQVPHAAAGLDLVLAVEPARRGGPAGERIRQSEGLGAELVPGPVAAVRARLRCGHAAVPLRGEPEVRRDAPALRHAPLAGHADRVDAHRSRPDA